MAQNGLGGAFDPSADYTTSGDWIFNGDVTVNGSLIPVATTLVDVSITGATITGTVTIATGASIINPHITGAVVTGTVTIATGCSIINPHITGAVITGTVTIATGCTITNPAITGAAVTGVVTVASGATLTTPTVLFTATKLTGTGTDATGAAAASAVVPAIIHITGASGAGINLPTGACVPGAMYFVQNINATGVQKVYSVGATINGTTGTTAFSMDSTGTAKTWFSCTTAGAWFTGPITT